MSARLRALWALRTTRERTIIAAVAALAGAVLFLWLVLSATRGRAELRAGITALRGEALRLERDAAEIERLRAAPRVAASHSDLRPLVEAQCNAAGVGGAVVRVEAAGPDQVSVVFGALAFADWLSLLQRLEAVHVRLESSRIEALATPGMVGVTATFTRVAAP
ncbi:MAG: type secretion system protein [Betaproteobacteria bacterium]|nr:type secretion system protein [Betaproteobacteria bacterium]